MRVVWSRSSCDFQAVVGSLSVLELIAAPLLGVTHCLTLRETMGTH